MQMGYKNGQDNFEEKKKIENLYCWITRQLIIDL